MVILMDNKINLSSYNLRTDLIVDVLDNNKNLNVEEEQVDNIKITRTTLLSEDEKIINKKKGNYITLEFDDITDFDNREKIGKCLEKEIKKLLSKLQIKESDECLIIGLGNENSTPDSLGPCVVKNILVTRHLFLLNTNVKEGIRSVSSFIPDVMGNTGIETSDIIKSLVATIKPQFIIVLDALASSSIDRLNKTIQITDTGIHPGSGVGNNRKEISKEILKIPVIAIGVPTVVEASTIVNDTIKYLLKHISYIKNNFSKNKLIYKRFNNYIDKINKNKLTKEEEKEILGLFGELTEEDKLNLINEVLNAINYNLMVTPKEIDFLIIKLSETIANSLNNALHRQITHY